MGALIKINRKPKLFKYLLPYLQRYIEQNPITEKEATDILMEAMQSDGTVLGVYLYVGKAAKVLGYTIVNMAVMPGALFVVQASIKPETGPDFVRCIISLAKSVGLKKVAFLSERTDKPEVWQRALRLQEVKAKSTLMEIDI